MLNQVVELKREVTAVQIPSGDVLTLPEGERVYITQILGGSYTVATDHGLARISRENADALGAGAEEPSPEAAALDENATLEERVWDTLKCVYDPEIPVDIVNLGLIYDVAVIELENGLHHVAVKMTLSRHPVAVWAPIWSWKPRTALKRWKGWRLRMWKWCGIPPGTRTWSARRAE
mgnify:CR=1 FL=1